MTPDSIQQMISVREAIESRHSVRQFVQEAIPRQDIEELFEMVRLAPSAWNLQPWRFHLVTEAEIRKQLQEAAYGQTQVSSAPAVVMVASDMEDVLGDLAATVHPGLSPEGTQEEVSNLSAFFGSMSVEERGQWGLSQTYIALGFLLLAAQGMGYATVPMLGFDAAKVREILGLPEHVKFAAMVPLGKQAKEGYAHHRHPLDKILTVHGS